MRFYLLARCFISYVFAVVEEGADSVLFKSGLYVGADLSFSV